MQLLGEVARPSVLVELIPQVEQLRWHVYVVLVRGVQFGGRLPKQGVLRTVRLK